MREHEPEQVTAWSELDWANMSADQVMATIAAMEREHWARAPEHEARRAKADAEAEARLIDAFRRAAEGTCRHEALESREPLGTFCRRISARLC